MLLNKYKVFVTENLVLHILLHYFSDRIYFYFEVWARTIPWTNISNEATQNCAAYFCVRKNCSNRSKGSHCSLYFLNVSNFVSIICFFNGPPLLDSFYRLGMRRILHLRIYTLFWLSSGKINNGMFLSCKWDVFYSLYEENHFSFFFFFYSEFIIKQWRI